MSEPDTVQYATPGHEPQSSGIALASMIVGICSIPVGCVIPFITGIVAIVLSVFGFKQTGPGKRQGRGFAIAGLVTGICGLIVPLPLLISILIPSLSRASETANRIKCASNMRQIGLAVILYANEQRDGAFPPDLETVFATQDISADAFVCPSGKSEAMSAAPGSPFTLGTDLDYIWVGDGLTNRAPATQPILFELYDNHAPDGGNVLYADGSVWFEQTADLTAEVNKLLNSGQMTQEQADLVLGK